MILDAPDAFGNRAAAYRLDRFAAVDHRYRKGPAVRYSAPLLTSWTSAASQRPPRYRGQEVNDMAQRMKFPWQTLFFSRS
ncbi:hypothetical protein [Saccharomonospora viridis]|uniref:Uncharacterized protein n=1 Tax=Saccharomonospora viridis (strain ATCC 15386 / DSM 43017 / JCM 3036 / CCUG 5913 / NBRC 12207 / NCIMB 9602 / P101) TaxID=471857 RepID=C7MU65_SACVD|nr:hypothetical protein [Saccharomonospora viridis]ACU96844.1 hypothetical protein Svir_18210 [Saccharomonospora viridis DSM 43017]